MSHYERQAELPDSFSNLSFHSEALRPSVNGERCVRTESVLGERFSGSPSLFVPEYLFNPADQWAVEFRQGLDHLEHRGPARIYEVGVGVGANAIHLLETRPEVEVIYGSDLEERSAPVAARNVAAVSPAQAHKFKPLFGARSLLTGVAEELAREGLARPNLVIGCIPQVKQPPAGAPTPLDEKAHYYHPEQGDDRLFGQYSLALNFRLLLQAAELLKPGDRIVLALSGRPPLFVLEALFEQAGFAPGILHTAAIEQHAGTSIDKMVEAEAQHHIRFEFHTDPSCQDPAITAAGAKRLYLDKGLSVYHTLHIMEGRLKERH